MARKDDGPGLILRVTPRGILPATRLDRDTLIDMGFSASLQATMIRERPNKALRAWWALMDAVVKHEPQWVSRRMLSNAILIKFRLVSSELLVGGTREEPVSLTEFSESQLWNLLEMAKLLVVQELIPGVDIRALTGHDG